MIWVLVAALGSVAWLSVVLFFLALCHAAGRADDRGQAMPFAVPPRQDANLAYLHAHRRPAPLRERYVSAAPARQASA